MVKVQGLFAKTNLKIPVCHIRSKQGLGQARPNKKQSRSGKNFQELKICGHGTVLALTVRIIRLALTVRIIRLAFVVIL